MRSASPRPGNPWPHHMVITITDDEQTLTDLLWVRALYDLTPRAADLPPQPLPIEPLPPTASAQRRDKHRWNQSWPELWFAALDRFAEPRPSPDPPSAAEVDQLSDKEVLALLEGATWRHRHGDDAFDEHYDRWLEQLAHHRHHLARTMPEHRSLTALILAWKHGLHTIVTIPCTGSYTRKIGRTALLVTTETRSDPASYDEALTSFTRD